MREQLTTRTPHETTELPSGDLYIQATDTLAPTYANLVREAKNRGLNAAELAQTADITLSQAQVAFHNARHNPNAHCPWQGVAKVYATWVHAAEANLCPYCGKPPAPNSKYCSPRCRERASWDAKLLRKAIQKANTEG